MEAHVQERYNIYIYMCVCVCVCVCMEENNEIHSSHIGAVVK